MKVNLRMFYITSGQAFPIHPLDLTIVSNATFIPSIGANAVTTTVCVGAWQSGTSPYPGIDLVLGANF